MTTSRPKVLVTHREIPEAGLKLLAEKCDLYFCDKIIENRAEILEKVIGMDGILWAMHMTPLNAEILDAAGPQLKALSTLSSGVDYVDVAEFKKRGIALGHTPFVLNDTVADLAVGLMIAAGRRFYEGRLAIESSRWALHPQWMLGHDVSRSTVGIVGFGGIGQAIAKRLQGFDLTELLYCGHSPKLEASKLNAKFVPLSELLRKSDFVILACPLTEETRFLFNLDRFKQMKRTSVFVNVARGRCVDQEALAQALKDGLIFSAGIDAMYPEPLPHDHPLTRLSNAVITPHLGTATIRTREEMCILAAHNVLRGLAGEKMLSPVP